MQSYRDISQVPFLKKLSLWWLQWKAIIFKYLAGFVWVIAILSWVAPKSINFPIPNEVVNGLILALIFFVLGEIYDDISKKDKSIVFSEQQDAFEFLRLYVSQNKAKEAIMIQYSSASCNRLLSALLKAGAHVTLYIQHEDVPKQLGSALQHERITWRCNQVRGELNQMADRLDLRKYHAPGSVCGVKIDDKVILMGWYIYEQADNDNQKSSYPGDILQVSGHDMAGIIAWNNTEEYVNLTRTFNVLVDNLNRNAEAKLQI